MMSINIINHEQSKTYYEKSKDYYTRSLTNYDRWHGSLAKVQGLTGEMSKEQFDMLSDHLAKSGREKRLGLDATFSAPKSVSLAMAISETNKEEIIRLHQAAVDKALETIEMDSRRAVMAADSTAAIWLQASLFISSTATTSWISTATASS